MKCAIIAMLVVVAMVGSVVRPSEAITCAEVNQFLSPCVPFLISGAGEPSKECCAGATKLEGAAQATADKRAACECVKATASHMSNIKPEAASSLPAKCKITLNIPISTTTNCQDIN